MRLVLFLGVGLLLLLGGSAVLLYVQSVDGGEDAVEMVTPHFTVPEPLPDVEVLVREWQEDASIEGEGSGKLQYWRCESEGCGVGEALSNSSHVTNGEWDYYFEESAMSDQGSKVYLRRGRRGGGDKETVMESTPLTSPRGLYLSPDGTKLAFWLDNIGDSEELTELWMYDERSGGVRLLAETIYAPDVRSKVQWDPSSTWLWFVADVGEQSASEDELQAIVVSSLQPGKVARFAKASLDQLVEEAVPVSLSMDGEVLAYQRINLFGRHSIELVSDDEITTSSIRGRVAWLSWSGPDELWYITQDARGYSLWKLQGGTSQLLARRDGQVWAAHMYLAEAVVGLVEQTEGAPQVVLVSGQGVVETKGRMPYPRGTVSIASVSSVQAAVEGDKVSVTPLEDAELAAVIDAHAEQIVGEDVLMPIRLVILEGANLVFFDWRDGVGQEKRVLVQVYDATHVDWAILARYVAINAEWQRVAGGTGQEPQPQRVYEWEQELSQWILKMRE